MEDKKILFITFDMSGYYTSVYEELKSRYTEVHFFNTATLSYKYESVFEKIYSFFYKIFTGKKLKNYYKYNHLVNTIKNNSFDITLVVRPDLFFDIHLKLIKKSTNLFIAYYHDSINNIKRKRKIIHFFDKVYSYEKKDVENYKLEFLPNFIYFALENQFHKAEFSAFSVMSKDYRLKTLKNIALFFKKNEIDYHFFVVHHKQIHDELITFLTKRIGNKEVVSNIQKSNIIVDINKFGIQDGLTFRVFESLGYNKKLITTNKDIKTYDFYNPRNIFIIEDIDNIDIPMSFFTTQYEPIPIDLINKYSVKSWVSNILKQ